VCVLLMAYLDRFISQPGAGKSAEVTRPSNNPVSMAKRYQELTKDMPTPEEAIAFGWVWAYDDRILPMPAREYAKRVQERWVIGDNEWEAMSDEEKCKWADEFDKVLQQQES
jgi:hypothetical protein